MSEWLGETANPTTATRFCRLIEFRNLIDFYRTFPERFAARNNIYDVRIISLFPVRAAGMTAATTAVFRDYTTHAARRRRRNHHRRRDDESNEILKKRRVLTNDGVVSKNRRSVTE